LPKIVYTPTPCPQLFAAHLQDFCKGALPLLEAVINDPRGDEKTNRAARVNAISSYTSIAVRCQPEKVANLAEWLPAEGDSEESIDIIGEAADFIASGKGADLADTFLPLLEEQATLIDRKEVKSHYREVVVAKEQLVGHLTKAGASAAAIEKVEAIWAPLLG
jgi:hypothetical protein